MFFLFLLPFPFGLIIWKHACAMIYPTYLAMPGLVFDSNIKKQHLKLDFMTITSFVLKEQSKHPESRGDLTILLNHILLGCKFVCSVVNKVFFSLLYPIINTRLGRENHVNMLCCHVLTFSSQNIFSWPLFIGRRDWQNSYAGETNVKVSSLFLISEIFIDMTKIVFMSRANYDFCLNWVRSKLKF